jgi:hypothetical protein
MQEAFYFITLIYYQFIISNIKYPNPNIPKSQNQQYLIIPPFSSQSPKSRFRQVQINSTAGQ